MIKRIKVTVTREDEYIIELDTDIINEQWQKEYEALFYKIDNLADLAETLAYHQIRMGSDYRFIEGFGDVKRDGVLRYAIGDLEDPPEAAPGINIVIIDEDNNYTFNTEVLP